MFRFGTQLRAFAMGSAGIGLLGAAAAAPPANTAAGSYRNDGHLIWLIAGSGLEKLKKTAGGEDVFSGPLNHGAWQFFRAGLIW